MDEEEIFQNRAVYWDLRDRGAFKLKWWVVVHNFRVLIYSHDEQPALDKMAQDSLTNCYFQQVGTPISSLLSFYVFCASVSAFPEQFLDIKHVTCWLNVKLLVMLL